MFVLATTVLTNNSTKAYDIPCFVYEMGFARKQSGIGWIPLNLATEWVSLASLVSLADLSKQTEYCSQSLSQLSQEREFI